MIQWINRKRNKKGFTLIELIVVIAILGILAAIAIPRFTGVRGNANQGVAISTLTIIQRAAETAAVQNNIALADVSATQIETAMGVTIASYNGSPTGSTYTWDDTNNVAKVENIAQPGTLGASFTYAAVVSP